MKLRETLQSEKGFKAPIIDNSTLEILAPHVVILGAGATIAALPKGDKNGKEQLPMKSLSRIERVREILYPFAIYAWNYVGMQPSFKVVPICGNELVGKEILNILQEAETDTNNISVDRNTWKHLESIHIAVWQHDKDKYLIDVENTANYKLESISSNYRNRKRSLEQKIRDVFEEKILRILN